MCPISDWFGRFNSVIVSQAMAVIVVFGLFYNVGTSAPTFYAFAALWGFANGAILGLMSPLLGEYVPCLLFQLSPCLRAANVLQAL